MITAPVRPTRLIPGNQVRPHDIVQIGGAWREIVSTPPADPITLARIPDARTAVCGRGWTLTLDPARPYEVVR